MDEVFVSEGVQGFAYGDVRHAHQFGQFGFIGQLFIGFEQARYDGIFEPIHHLFGTGCLAQGCKNNGVCEHEIEDLIGA